MPPAIRRPTPFDVSRLIFVGAIWGGAFLFISLALEDFGPISIATWRVTLGALVLLAWDPTDRAIRTLYPPFELDRGGEYWLRRSLAPGEYQLEIVSETDSVRTYPFVVDPGAVADVFLEAE